AGAVAARNAGTGGAGECQHAGGAKAARSARGRNRGGRIDRGSEGGAGTALETAALGENMFSTPRFRRHNGPIGEYREGEKPMIEFPCPTCRTNLSMPDAAAGKET